MKEGTTLKEIFVVLGLGVCIGLCVGITWAPFSKIEEVPGATQFVYVSSTKAAICEKHGGQINQGWDMTKVVHEHGMDLINKEDICIVKDVAYGWDDKAKGYVGPSQEKIVLK